MGCGKGTVEEEGMTEGRKEGEKKKGKGESS